MCLAESVTDCRFPEHPCPDGFGCFFYIVEAHAQALADRNGYCLGVEACEAAAAELPGGGKCVIH
jgi:hypothetical protein